MWVHKQADLPTPFALWVLTMIRFICLHRHHQMVTQKCTQEVARTDSGSGLVGIFFAASVLVQICPPVLFGMELPDCLCRDTRRGKALMSARGQGRSKTQRWLKMFVNLWPEIQIRSSHT